jgi:hypothetical protein
MTNNNVKKNLNGLLLSSHSRKLKNHSHRLGSHPRIIEYDLHQLENHPHIVENEPHQLENHLHRLENGTRHPGSHSNILENDSHRLSSDRHGQKVDLLEKSVGGKKFKMMIIPYLGNNFQIKIKKLKFIKEVEYVFYSKKYVGTFSKCQNGPY